MSVVDYAIDGAVAVITLNRPPVNALSVDLIVELDAAITRAEALEMIHQVKGVKLLQGFRGTPEADIDALADTLVNVSHLAVNLEGQLSELDINPLMVLPKGQGVKAADALAVF